jgi:hypothetical protein
VAHATLGPPPLMQHDVCFLTMQIPSFMVELVAVFFYGKACFFLLGSDALWIDLLLYNRVYACP